MTEATIPSTVETVWDAIQKYPVFIEKQDASTGETLIFLAEGPDDVEDNIREGDVVLGYDYDTGIHEDDVIVDDDRKETDLLKGKCPVKDDSTDEVLDPDDPDDPRNQAELDKILEETFEEELDENDEDPDDEDDPDFEDIDLDDAESTDTAPSDAATEGADESSDTTENGGSGGDPENASEESDDSEFVDVVDESTEPSETPTPTDGN